MLKLDIELCLTKVDVLFCHQCPETEPKLCRYLRVCEPCNERVQSRQVADYEATSPQPAHDQVNETWLFLQQVNDKLRKLQTKIDDNLPKVGIHCVMCCIREMDSSLSIPTVFLLE